MARAKRGAFLNVVLADVVEEQVVLQDTLLSPSPRGQDAPNDPGAFAPVL
jgi:hypothetical protein